ncbi:MBL fold metallo-hydrolase [Candidatus Riflebacteria bacterium]
MSLELILWGTRGDISSPGPELLEFGGYTPCGTVKDNKGNLIILDAGFGLAHFSDHLGKPVSEYHILLSHFHWAHIQGLGFFLPIFLPFVTVHFYSAYPTKELETALDMYFDGSYGPFNGYKSMPAKLEFHLLKKTQMINGFKVDIAPLFHNDPCHAFKISKGRKSIVYAANHEVSDLPRAQKNNQKFIKFCEKTDILIHDAFYTEEEYELKKGMGHSSMAAAVNNGIVARCKKILLFYHEPLRTDKELTRLETKLQKVHSKERIDIEFAREKRIFTV